MKKFKDLSTEEFKSIVCGSKELREKLAPLPARLFRMGTIINQSEKDYGKGNDQGPYYKRGRLE